MLRSFLFALIGVCLLVAAWTRGHASAATGSGADNFAWSGSVAAGNWVHVRNLNGPITVEPAASGPVSVTAHKEWHGRAGRNITFVQHDTPDGVVICTVYGDRGNCSAENYDLGLKGGGFFGFSRGHAKVSYTVNVPPGVKVDISTVNGRLNVNAPQEVRAETVNGDVDVGAARGAVKATTVNGDVSVRLDSVDPASAVHLETVNGSVIATLPRQLDANLDLETVNGRVVTGYPLTVTGKVDPKHVVATLGTGGANVHLETVNGRVELKPVQ